MTTALGRGAAAAVTLALVASAGFGGSAVAAEAQSGLWYIDAFHIPEAHAAGFTGEGITIAVIDSPVNMEVPALANSNVEVQEPSLCLDGSGKPLPATSTEVSGERAALHGTGVVSMISGTGDGYPGQQGVKGVAPGARVLYYAANFENADGGLVCDTGDGLDSGPEMAAAKAMNMAMDAGADIVSISLGLNATEEFSDAVARAHREGVVVLGAVPNVQLNMAAHWPASGNGVVAVQAIDSSGTPQSEQVGDLMVPNGFTYTSVSGPGVQVLEQGTETGGWQEQTLSNGTSFATPAVAGLLALVLQKYPEATGNQLIQTLIRNTGVEDHEASQDPFLGYGIASATHMLEKDPAQYPDDNPLVTDDNIPYPKEFIGVAPTAAPDAPDSPSTVPWGLIIGLGVGGLVVVAGLVALIIVIVVRKSRARSTESR